MTLPKRKDGQFLFVVAFLGFITVERGGGGGGGGGVNAGKTLLAGTVFQLAGSVRFALI